jgi:trk system potassium uptake protein TrkH
MTSSPGSHPTFAEATQEALDLQRQRRVPVPLRLLTALAALIGLGAGLLLLPWMTTQPISFMDALFTATSASAVTGLAVLTTSTAFTRPGQWVILGLMQFGGLGFLVTVVLTLRLLGRRISLVDRLAVSSSLGLASPKAILQVLGRTVAFMLAVEGIGALILWAHWRWSGIVPAGDAVFYALFHAVAAFCNAGFDLFSGLPQYPEGLPTDPITLLTLGWLAIIGGLGIPVYMELLHRRTDRHEGQTAQTPEPANPAGALVGTDPRVDRLAGAASRRVSTCGRAVPNSRSESGCCGPGSSQRPRAPLALLASAISPACTSPAGCC